MENFPDLRRRFSDARFGKYSIYMLFFDLLPMVRDSLANGDDRTAQRIFAFAQWCSVQHTGETSNAANLAFYEHLFDRREDWEFVIPFLSPDVICRCMGLWEARPRTILSDDDLQQLRLKLDFEHVCGG